MRVTPNAFPGSKNVWSANQNPLKAPGLPPDRNEPLPNALLVGLISPGWFAEVWNAGTAVAPAPVINQFAALPVVPSVMGAAAAEYICKRLKGKGNIAIVDLPSNEAWSTRSDGLRFVLSRYPDIKVVAECAFALTGLATPQEAIAEMLVAHKNIDAIWNA